MRESCTTRPHLPGSSGTARVSGERGPEQTLSEQLSGGGRELKDTHPHRAPLPERARVVPHKKP